MKDKNLVSRIREIETNLEDMTDKPLDHPDNTGIQKDLKFQAARLGRIADDVETYIHGSGTGRE